MTISGNRLIVNSTNFKLDGNGNDAFNGDVRGANIYGSTLIGGEIDINGGFFSATDDENYVGEFYATYTDRALFMSTDQYTGMSARASARRFALWAAYSGVGDSNISNYTLLLMLIWFMHKR